jgi:tetratricopeptide (TPR) repeat protein
LTLYKTAAKANPTVSEPYLALGKFYVQQGRYDDAAFVFQETLSIAPDNISGYLELSDLQRVRGDWKLAIQTLEKAVQIDPRSADAHLQLASIYLQRGDYATARTEYSLAIQVEPSNNPGANHLKPTGVSDNFLPALSTTRSIRLLLTSVFPTTEVGIHFGRWLSK